MECKIDREIVRIEISQSCLLKSLASITRHSFTNATKMSKDTSMYSRYPKISDSPPFVEKFKGIPVFSLKIVFISN